MGGKSQEHEISLISGAQVVKNLSSAKYKVFPIVVSKNGTDWTLRNRNQFLLKNQSIILNRDIQKANHTTILRENKIDVVFIAMHGTYGEDGSIQGFLELLGVPYTGSKILASSICMDKSYSKTILNFTGVLTPSGLEVRKNQKVKFKNVKFPVFVKPADQGSSVGSSIASSLKELKSSLKNAYKTSDRVLIEEYIQGTEITCAILGNSNPKALPLVEIISKNPFFDYESKYDPKLSDEICPARISKTLTKKAQDIAILAYNALGCSVFARVDMIIKNNKIYVLEVNTIPGLTPVSLFPKAASAAGLSYAGLLDRIINLSLAN